MSRSLALTLGEPAGIGPDITLMAWQRRVELALPAFLKAGGQRYSVRLLDLSNGGAKLTCPAQLASGTAVVLDCGTFCLSAEVRWQNDRFLGLCFETELDEREVAALVARSRCRWRAGPPRTAWPARRWPASRASR